MIDHSGLELKVITHANHAVQAMQRGLLDVGLEKQRSGQGEEAEAHIDNVVAVGQANLEDHVRARTHDIPWRVPLHPCRKPAH